jgi:MoaA/NifB/PqqE/SkfB family radical SAM enzyme
MHPMMRRKEVIARLAATYGPAMRVRVSLDDHRAHIHDRERGEGGFARAMEGLRWLASQGVTVEVAGRYVSGDTEDQLRAGFARVLHAHGVEIDTSDPRQLVLFPEMATDADPP